MGKIIILITLFSIGLTQHIVPNLSKTKQEQQILSATVMITITTPNWQETATAVSEALPIPNDEYRTIARADGYIEADGLGTLIEHDSGPLLVTHDHWSNFDAAVGTVIFRDADGSRLAEIGLRDFRDHIRYRNGGMLVLSMPDHLQTAVSAKAQNPTSSSLQAGEKTFLTRRANGRVVVTPVNVVTRAEKEGVPVLHLQSADGQPVTGGDSGGGLWQGDHFAGVTWTTIQMENQSTGTRRATDLSVAALYQGYPISRQN